ncbi:Ig-like domain-containing protein, partial [Belliella sp. DSM 111904]
MQRVKVLLFLFIFLNGNTPIKAATFYISSSSGNDNETAARAQNENSPWKSIDKLNSIMNSLSPGDKVLFKRGDVFYGTIKINRHNNSNNAIEFGAYGTGDKPIITSFVEVNGWSSVGNGVYEAELRITEIEKINVFTIDETPYELGRFPNFDGPNKGYLNIESTPNNNSIISSNLSGSSNWSGGEIVIRKNPWIIDRHNISSHSSTRINYSTNSSHYNANKGYGFFIQNHLNTLDQFGEWYYDKNNQKLYVYFGDRSPANHTVKISNLPYLISFGWDIGNITINDLDLRGANTTGIRIQQGTNVKILNTNISLTGENAILGILSHDLEISNCSINHSLNNGIQIQNSTRNVKILNNEIKNTHVFNGMGMSADLNGQAIYTTNDSHNGLIENNRIYNTGYIAINFGGNNTVVKNNFIDNFCMHKSDGGGIYTWEGPDNKNMSGRVVEGNIIVNGVGYKEGTLYNGTISPTPIEGIYLDDNSSGIEIKNNTVSNVSNNGVYFHNARNILYENNLSYSCQQHVLLSHDEYGDPIRNIKIENNIFFTPNPNEKFLKVFSIKDDFEYMGNFHNNYYINPFGNDFGFINEFLHPNLNIDSKLMNLSWWGRDSSGHLTPKEHPYLEVLERSENNLFRNKDFTENVQHTFCNGNCDRTWSNNEFFQGGHVVVNTKVKSKFTLETGSLKENKYYLLKFTAKSNKEGYISLEFNENVDPWRFLTETRGFNISKDIQEYEFIFYNNIETRSSFITLKSELNDFSYGLDEVELLEIEVDQFNAEDFLFFEYNNTPSPQRFPLSGSYLDAKNNSFTSAIEIPPFSSAALIRLSTEKTQEHEPPIIQFISPSTDRQLFVGEKLKIEIEAESKYSEINIIEVYVDEILIKSFKNTPEIFEQVFEEEGDFILKAKAIDINGMEAFSESLNISVSHSEIAPTISWLSPSDNDFFFESDPIKLEVSVDSDEQNIENVEFSINNNVVGFSNTLPYQISLPNLPLGSHNLKAIAKSSNGLFGETEIITINVVAAANIPPSIIISSPSNNSTFTFGDVISINTEAQDTDGTITQVEFFNGTSHIGILSSEPFTFVWDNAPLGNHSITARATDDKGAVAISSPINIQVNEKTNIAPTINITSPSNNSTFTFGDVISINAEALDADRTITQVEFFNGTSHIGTLSSEPFTFVWGNAPLGNHSITARATDDKGAVAISSPINIQVNEKTNIAPTINITSPSNNSTFT